MFSLSQVPQTAFAHWIDGVFLCILLFSLIEGFLAGALYTLADLIEFALSFFLGLLLYSSMGSLLTTVFSLPVAYSNALGFFLVSFFAALILYVTFRNFIKKANQNILSYGSYLKKLNMIIGIIPGVLSGAIFIMFLVTVLTAFPLSADFKKALTNATLGSFFIARSEGLQSSISGSQTLNFLTIQPQSNMAIALGFTDAHGTVDKSAEEQMLTLVNAARLQQGLPVLVQDSALQQLAEQYAQDMLAGGYFSHDTKSGLSPFDRMQRAHISYTYAGENLAFAANVTIAMQGLLNSPAHKANILSPHYKKIGIGVVDGGAYGEMFVQEFTD